MCASHVNACIWLFKWLTAIGETRLRLGRLPLPGNFLFQCLKLLHYLISIFGSLLLFGGLFSVMKQYFFPITRQQFRVMKQCFSSFKGAVFIKRSFCARIPAESVATQCFSDAEQQARWLIQKNTAWGNTSESSMKVTWNRKKKKCFLRLF